MSRAGGDTGLKAAYLLLDVVSLLPADDAGRVQQAEVHIAVMDDTPVDRRRGDVTPACKLAASQQSRSLQSLKPSWGRTFDREFGGMLAPPDLFDHRAPRQLGVRHSTERLARVLVEPYLAGPAATG
jgi:hypothetical protein